MLIAENVVRDSVYYYFYEHAREIILRSRAGSKGLGTLEAMLAGVVAGAYARRTSQCRPC